MCRDPRSLRGRGLGGIPDFWLFSCVMLQCVFVVLQGQCRCGIGTEEICRLGAGKGGGASRVRAAGPRTGAVPGPGVPGACGAPHSGFSRLRKSEAACAAPAEAFGVTRCCGSSTAGSALARAARGGGEPGGWRPRGPGPRRPRFAAAALRSSRRAGERPGRAGPPAPGALSAGSPPSAVS